MKTSTHFTLLTGIAGSLLTASLLLSCLEPADQIMERYGEGKMVFVKEPSVGGTNKNNNVAMSSNVDEFHPGTDICLLSPISPTGKLTNLTAQWTRSVENANDWGAAADPEVSFDGAKIIFSMRRPRTQNSRNQHWGIYEMNTDGTNLVQLTNPEVGHDIDPAYIDETHIVFGSTRNQILDEYERRSVPQLFVGEISRVDGSLVNIRQITFNQSHDQNPFVHSSGKIYYTRWDHLGGPNKMPLFSVNPDGTGQFVLSGADETFSKDNTSGQRTLMEARELRDGGLITSLMERTSQFEGGAIGIVDLSKFTSPPQIITPGSSPYNNTQKVSNALFKTPYPIMDAGHEKILVAQSAHDAGNDVEGAYANYDLFIMDKDGSNLKLIHADPKNNDYDPIVITPRLLPVKPFVTNPLVSEALANGIKTGKFFDADVYSRQDNDGHMSAKDLLGGGTDRSKGLAKFVRVIEAVPMSAQYRNMDNVGRTEFEKQRVIGYGDVRADGSLSLEVPANTPLHMQTLDENGMMLVNQFQWINVMPGEQRMCTGCHGAREKDQDITHFNISGDSVIFKLAEVKNYLSGFYNAQKVTAHPAARSDTLDFMSLVYPAKTATIQALMERRCNSCHGATVAKDSGGSLVLQNLPDTALNNHGTTNVYNTLTEDDGYVTAKTGTKRRYVTPEGARESPLAWILLNKQLSDKNETLFRKPSYDHSTLWQKDSTGHMDPFAKENVDYLALIEWMDMGTQFSNSNALSTVK
jgi:hypothetical protein